MIAQRHLKAAKTRGLSAIILNDTGASYEIVPVRTNGHPDRSVQGDGLHRLMIATATADGAAWAGRTDPWRFHIPQPEAPKRSKKK